MVHVARSIVDPRFAETLRRLRQERGLSMRALATRALSSKSNIGHFEAGTRAPNLETARRLEEALDAPGELVALIHGDHEGALDSHAGRREAAALNQRSVTTGDVEAVRDFTRTFRALDNRYGGGHSHNLAAQYLDANVTAMLRHGTYTETVGRDLFGAASQLAHLAAWTAYDIGGHKRAELFFGRALELASAAGDHAFSGEILAARGHQAIHLRSPATAVELARASQQAAKTSGVSALLSEALALEANAQAMLRNRSACTAALHAAEVAFDQVKPAESPEWLRYFDEGYLAARFAHTLCELGEQAQARQYALQALAMSESLTRTRAFNTVQLASTYVDSELDMACDAGAQAVALAARLRSSRIVRYLNDFRGRLGARHRNDPLVTRFEEQVTETLGVP